MTAVFLAHARADQDYAKDLAGFLEFGCNLTCDISDGQIGDKPEDLISKAEEGLSADVLLLLLSPSSSPTRWVRERWEPVLFDQAKQGGVEVVTLLLGECSFPQLLRRRNFIDGTANWLSARRVLKRWFMLRDRQPGAAPSLTVSDDLEDLYSALADRAGMLLVSAEVASRFATEAEEEFEAVQWVPCHGRTLAQASGEVGHQLGLTLDGPAEENCVQIRELLATRRCLLVLDAPQEQISRELIAGGRTSTAITQDTLKILETPETPDYARRLIASRRYAEAYELLYRLLETEDDPESCARELTWICEHWDRVEEANVLRFSYRSEGAEQLRLF